MCRLTPNRRSVMYSKHTKNYRKLPLQFYLFCQTKNIGKTIGHVRVYKV